MRTGLRFLNFQTVIRFFPPDWWATLHPLHPRGHWVFSHFSSCFFPLSRPPFRISRHSPYMRFCQLSTSPPPFLTLIYANRMEELSWTWITPSASTITSMFDTSFCFHLGKQMIAFSSQRENIILPKSFYQNQIEKIILSWAIYYLTYNCYILFNNHRFKNSFSGDFV